MVKAILKFQSNCCDSLNRIFDQFLEVSQNLKIKYYYYFLPKKRKFWTLIKSVFAYKVSKEQFELIIYKKVLVLESNNLELHYFNDLEIPSNIEIKFFFKREN